MKSRLKVLLLLLGSLLVVTIAIAQNLYKWVDENGRVTYSDQPPVGKVKSQEVVKIQSATNTGAARQVTDQDTQFKKRQDEAAKKQAETSKKEAVESVRQENCARARGELRALRDNVPLARLNESGERVAIDDATRESEAKRLETFLGENCTQPNG